MRKVKWLLILSILSGFFIAHRNPDVLPGPLGQWVNGAKYWLVVTWDDLAGGPSDMVYSGGSPGAGSNTLTLTRGRVVEVIDGDSLVISLEGGERAESRLHGIDAPEWNQPHGKAAERALAWKVLWRRVNVAVVEEDKYGRKVVLVKKGDRDINVEMVCEGHAWWYERFAADAEDLEACQEAAKQRNAGLWAAEEPVPPWQWRQ